MPNQVVLAWDVDTLNSPLGPIQAAAALGAVELYQGENFDPVLGQFFGLTVVDDISAPTGPTTATRTLTLQMTASGLPQAPPSFPCHPITAEPPGLPFPLREAVTLYGSFFVENGVSSVPTAQTQEHTLSVGEQIQFMSQQGEFYEVASVGSTSIGLTFPYTGVTSNTTASKEVTEAATRIAFFSTSELDTNGVATTDPVIGAGAGARTVSLTYKDSTGATFSVTTSLTGRRPAMVALAGGSIDIASVEDIVLASFGGFGNSLGQITLVELTDDLPTIPAGTPIGTGNGATEDWSSNPLPIRTFKSLTDQAQLLIGRHIAYLPPSYFALSQQGAATPQLEGDFFVTTASAGVSTTEDQTAALSATNVIEFAEQPGTRYTIQSVTPKIVTLLTPYTGIDTNRTKQVGDPTINAGTMGHLGTAVLNRRTGARRLIPSPATPPTDAELSTLLAQFVALETASPPPSPPGFPSTVPTPTFLSGMFTRTLQLALAGVRITPQTITFA